MGTGLAVLSGLLGGLSGLPRGMEARSQEDLARERLAQTQQQIDQSSTDVGQLMQLLGVQAPAGVTPGMKLPNATAGVVASKALADQQERVKRAQLEGLRSQVPEQARPFLGIPGGPELYKTLYGQEAGKLIPTDKPIYDPQRGQWIQPPAGTQAPPFVPPAGYRPIPTVSGKGEVSTRYEPQPWQQEMAAKALADAGWRPDMPGYNQALYQAITPLTPVTEGGFAVPRTMGVPSPPRAGAIDPRVPLAQQPTVQDAGKALQGAVGNLAAQAGALPGVPSPAPAGGPTRMPGGGVQGPPKRLSAEEAGALGMPFGSTQQEAAGRTPLTAVQRTKLDQQNAALAIVDQIDRDVASVQMPKSPAGRIGAIPGALYNVYGQGDPKLAALHKRLEGTLAQLVRALGESGNLNEGDIERARGLQPVFAPIPDTEAVVKEKISKLRELVIEVMSRTGSRPGASSGQTPGRRRFNPATGRLE